MLRALFERGIRPDLILGSSIGALNGAVVAQQPQLEVVDRLVDIWRQVASRREVFGDRWWNRAIHVARTGTALCSTKGLRLHLGAEFGTSAIEDLPVQFECCATAVERATEHWFTSGLVTDAVLASSAVPGVFRPVEIRGEHFYDGGLVNVVPLVRAIDQGARRVFILDVAQHDHMLNPPRWIYQVPRLMFEILRRQRLHREIATIEPDVEVHLLPTGVADPATLGWTDGLKFTQAPQAMRAAYRHSAHYLDSHGIGP